MTARMLKNRIISFEQAELAGKPDGTPSQLRITEAVAYFGSIALFIATVALTVEVALTDDFLFGGIDNVKGGFVVLVGAIVLFALGYRFTGEEEGAIKRAGGFTLASGFGLWAMSINLLLLELDAGDFTPALVAVPVAAGAWWAYQRHQSVPTQLAGFAAALQLMNAFLVLIQVSEFVDPQSRLVGLAIDQSAPEADWLALIFQIALGVAWVWYTNAKVLHPRNTGFALGGGYAVLQAASLFGTDDAWVILFAAVTGFVLYGGFVWRSSVLLGIGAAALALFVWMIYSILVDEVTAMSIFLWFGVPGLVAMGYVLFSTTQMANEESD